MARSTLLAVLAAVVMALVAGVIAGRMSVPNELPDAATTASLPAEKQVLYYRNPMGLADTSPVPKQDSMGMDYIPVYADDDAAGAKGGIALSPERIQTLGVMSEPARSAAWVREIRAVGRFTADETSLSTVTTKYEGWIETLRVNAVGQTVRAGQPLMAIYSPELVSTQQEYLVALQARRRLASADPQASAGAESLLRAARERLRNWDISTASIDRLERSGEVQRTLSLHAPSNGVVLERMATLGMRVMPGERLFEIADLSRLWLIVDVFEQDLGVLGAGAEALIEVSSEPGLRRQGKVDFVYPTLDDSTRTTKVRIVVDNADGRLRPGMYATATLQERDAEPRTTVPDMAVLDTGTRQLVIVALGEGRFEPRTVQAGRRADGRIEILDGLRPGEAVVTRANFLIDAESNLRAAVSGLSPHAGHEGAAAVDTPDHSQHRTDAAADLPAPDPQAGHAMPQDHSQHRAEAAGATPAPDPHAAHATPTDQREHQVDGDSAASSDPHADHQPAESAAQNHDHQEH